MLTPKFTPFYPQMLNQGFNIIEILVFGFITYFLSTNKDFYCTNKQIADLFGTSEKTVSMAIKKLSENGYIQTGYSIREGGGRIRFITVLNKKHNITKSNLATLQNVKLDITNCNVATLQNVKIDITKCNEIDNNIIENKKIDNKIIEEKEIIKEKEVENETKKITNKDVKKKYGDKVELTDEEYSLLVKEFGECSFKKDNKDYKAYLMLSPLVVDKMIDRMNVYLSKPNKQGRTQYDNYFIELEKWLKKDKGFIYGKWDSLQEIHNHLETDKNGYLALRYRSEYGKEAYKKLTSSTGEIDVDIPYDIFDNYDIVLNQ